MGVYYGESIIALTMSTICNDRPPPGFSPYQHKSHPGLLGLLIHLKLWTRTHTARQHPHAHSRLEILLPTGGGHNPRLQPRILTTDVRPHFLIDNTPAQH